MQAELDQLLEKRSLFDPDSRDPKAYESELKVLCSHALLNEALGQSNNQMEHFTYVFGQLRANKVALTPAIEARMFEYAILSDKVKQANDLLQSLSENKSEALSPIDTRFLR